MNIVLLTHDDPIYMPRYLEPVIEEQADRISEVVLAPTQKSFTTEIQDRYIMFGPFAFVRFGLMYVKGKGLDLLPTKFVRQFADRYYSVQGLANAYDIPVREESNVNKNEFVESIRDEEPDLLLSIACGQRLEEPLLEVPKKGAINIHGSLLPKYRGLATSFWVLYNDEDESGVTAHYMTPEYDTGDIISQRKYPISSDDTMHDVYLKLLDVGPKVANSAIEQIAQGSVDPKPNNVDEGEYYTLPNKRERNEFLERGNRFM